MNMLKIPIYAHGFTTSTYTQMECLNIDFISQFSDQGYIRVIVDTFTRWVELYHTTDATALSAAECLLKHFGRSGARHQLRSDNGPHFMAEIIRGFLHLVGVKHCLTLAYSKEDNAILERYNKEINQHLCALTFEYLSFTDYKKSLPFVQRILNCNHSVVRKGCVALHYSVHFFCDFSLSRNDRYRGGGYRRKILTVPTPFLCLPDPLRKVMDSKLGPCVW